MFSRFRKFLEWVGHGQTVFSIASWFGVGGGVVTYIISTIGGWSGPVLWLATLVGCLLTALIVLASIFAWRLFKGSSEEKVSTKPSVHAFFARNAAGAKDDVEIRCHVRTSKKPATIMWRYATVEKIGRKDVWVWSSAREIRTLSEAYEDDNWNYPLLRQENGVENILSAGSEIVQFEGDNSLIMAWVKITTGEGNPTRIKQAYALKAIGGHRTLLEVNSQAIADIEGSEPPE